MWGPKLDPEQEKVALSDIVRTTGEMQMWSTE